MSVIVERTNTFCERFGLSAPILLAPMAGACEPPLSIAVANSGGLGACGALMMQPEEIIEWSRTVREATDGGFQVNLWIPDPPPRRDPDHEAVLRKFLEAWGPVVPVGAGDSRLPDFDAQCEAMFAVAPRAVSSIMGLYPGLYVQALRDRGIAWLATVTTVGEARAAEAAGADVIVAQGAEAGGHRGRFDASKAEQEMVGLFALLPAVVDAVAAPVVATGGIADARGVAAALMLGASAVQIGTAFLRSPEAGINLAWAAALGRTAPEDTIITRAFSGRAGRSIATEYVRAAMADGVPGPAPYPVQRGLTASMRVEAQKAGDVERMQVWAGQSAALGSAKPASELVQSLWEDAQAVIG